MKDHLELTWKLLRYGEQVSSGVSDFPNIPPGEQATIAIDFQIPKTNKRIVEEYWLELNFSLTANTIWASKGHVVATHQSLVYPPIPTRKALPAPSKPQILPIISSFLKQLSEVTTSRCCSSSSSAINLIIDETDTTLSITGTQGSGFRVVFSKQSGAITNYTHGGNTLIDSPSALPNLWRAPTDNDEGGGNNSFASGWIRMGLRYSTLQGVNLTYRVDTATGNVIVEVTGYMPVVQPSGIFAYSATFVVQENAEIDMRFHWEAFPNFISEFPPIPRVGVTFLIPKTYSQFSWYGRGPFESYPDRKDSAKFGYHSGTVADQYHAYIRPQEYGNKADTRWASLHSAQTSIGLTARAWLENEGAETPLSSFHTSVHEYSLQNLTDAMHPHDLVPHTHISWYIDAGVQGLGGDDSWSPRTHEEYLLKEKEYTLTFTLSPYKSGVPY